MSELHDKIIKFKEENPHLGYQSISKAIGCSKNTVRYHLDPSQKEAVRNRVRKLRKTMHPLYRRIIGFCTDYGLKTRGNKNPMIQFKDVLEMIGDNPVCYLTGEPIDILTLSSFSLDHKIPLCKGGKSTIDNLGLTTPLANFSKNGMTPQEYFDHCKKVLIHQGYSVIDP